MDESNFWTRRRLSRRSMLRGAALGAAGLAGAALIGCGDDDDDAPAAGAAATAAATQATAQATTAPAAPTYLKGGTIRFGGWGQARFLSPRAVRGGNHHDYLNVAGDPYLYINEDGSIDPSLSLWETYEQTDETTIVANLRQGVKFHDGRDFNAEEVKRILEYITVEENVPNFGFFSWLSNFKSAEVIDEYTVKINATAPDASFLWVFCLVPGIPFSMDKAEKLGDDELRLPALTGPYTVESYTEDVGWMMVANPDYWGPKDRSPTFDRVEYIGIRDPKVKAAALQAGDLDAAWFGASDESTKLLTDDGRFTQQELQVAPRSLEINWAKPPLDDLRVRAALASSIDKEKVVSIVYQGQSSPATTGLMPPDVFGSLSYEKYPFDLAEAKKFLDASGLEQPVKLGYTYSGSGTAETLLMAQIYQETMRQIGLEMDIENAPSSSVRASGWRNGEIHLVIGSPGVRPDPTIQFNIYASGVGSLNPGGRFTTDPIQAEIDTMIKATMTNFDQEVREEIFHDLQRIMNDNVIGRVAVANRIRRIFGTDDVGGMDGVGVVNAPGGAGYRLRRLWMKNA
jgi:ABC-type transport system substrate-binding protein